MACLNLAEAVQHEGQGLLQCLVEFQLLLNVRFADVKRLISTPGVAVLRVPKAKRGGRVGQEINKMGRN